MCVPQYETLFVFSVLWKGRHLSLCVTRGKWGHVFTQALTVLYIRLQSYMTITRGTRTSDDSVSWLLTMVMMSYYNAHRFRKGMLGYRCVSNRETSTINTFLSIVTARSFWWDTHWAHVLSNYRNHRWLNKNHTCNASFLSIIFDNSNILLTTLPLGQSIWIKVTATIQYLDDSRAGV